MTGLTDSRDPQEFPCDLLRDPYRASTLRSPPPQWRTWVLAYRPVSDRSSALRRRRALLFRNVLENVDPVFRSGACHDSRDVSRVSVCF